MHRPGGPQDAEAPAEAEAAIWAKKRGRVFHPGVQIVNVERTEYLVCSVSRPVS